MARAGWATRRAKQVARSEAARKGWTTRRKRAVEKRKVAGTPTADYLVSFKYGEHDPRQIDFVVTRATSASNAQARARRYVQRRIDDDDSDLAWIQDRTGGLDVWRSEPVFLGASTAGSRGHVEPR